MLKISKILKPFARGVKILTDKPITIMAPPATRVTNGFRGRHILFAEKCISCGLCERVCPNKAIVLVNDERAKRGRAPSIDYSRCCYCGLCVDVCPTKALQFTNFYTMIAPDKEMFKFTSKKLSERPNVRIMEIKGKRKIRGWAISRSIWLMSFPTGCCFIEAVPWMSNLYDMERLGMVVVGSPRHADAIVIGGYVTKKMMKRILKIYSQMSKPKFVIALGVCPMTGGTYWDSYNTIKRIDKYIPVDIYISGCPPRPEAIGEAIVAAMKMIERGYYGKEERINTEKGKMEVKEIDVESDEYTLVPIGPAHPALCGLDILVKLKGERVIDAKVNVGYLHRGFEKLAEYRTWWQNVALLQRICVSEGSHYELVYSETVETIAGIEPPPRAKYLRVIQAELSRIQSHLFNLGMIAGATGFNTVKIIALGHRELTLQMIEKLTGARIYPIYNVPGGVRRDIKESFKRDLLEYIRKMKKEIKVYDDLLFSNEIFISRTRNIGIIPKDDIPKYHIVGPNARASGIDYDVRKRRPYEAYDNIDFEVIKCKKGDAYDRTLCRRREIEESLRILEQAINDIPSGSIRETKMKNGKRLTPFVPIPEGEAIRCVESARGELCFYIISRGELHPYRVKIFGPTFSLILKYLPKLLIGAYFADVPVIYTSLDNCPADHDR